MPHDASATEEAGGGWLTSTEMMGDGAEKLNGGGGVGGLHRHAPPSDRRGGRAWLSTRRILDTCAAATGRARGRRGQRGLAQCNAISWGHMQSGDEFGRRNLVLGRVRAHSGRGQWHGAMEAGVVSAGTARSAREAGSA
jgi:hypothetical protein